MIDREILLPILSAALIGGYHVWLAAMIRRSPKYTIHSLLDAARVAWVVRMINDKEGILAVQTLRNAIMGATFFASTAIALIVGTITLSVQGDRLTQIWASSAAPGPIDQHLWLVKILLLLIDMMCAFIFFAQAIRLNAHVGVLVGVPKDRINPDVVADLFIRAGSFHRHGMRCYYLSGPLIFWLFGPVAMFAASIVLAFALHFLDRSPLREAAATPGA